MQLTRVDAGVVRGQQEAGGLFLGLVSASGAAQGPLLAGGQRLGQAAALLLGEGHISIAVLLGV